MLGVEAVIIAADAHYIQVRHVPEVFCSPLPSHHPLKQFK